MNKTHRKSAANHAQDTTKKTSKPAARIKTNPKKVTAAKPAAATIGTHNTSLQHYRLAVPAPGDGNGFTAVYPDELSYGVVGALADEFNLEILAPGFKVRQELFIKLPAKIRERLHELQAQPPIPEMTIPIYVVLGHQGQVLRATESKSEAEIWQANYAKFYKTEGRTARIVETSVFLSPDIDIALPEATKLQPEEWAVVFDSHVLLKTTNCSEAVSLIRRLDLPSECLWSSHAPVAAMLRATLPEEAE